MYHKSSIAEFHSFLYIKNMISCSLVDGYQRFETIRPSIFKAVFILKELATFPSSKSLFTKLHGFVFYMTVMLILQVLETLNILQVCM
jgi:hypothetical protein